MLLLVLLNLSGMRQILMLKQVHNTYEYVHSISYMEHFFSLENSKITHTTRLCPAERFVPPGRGKGVIAVGSTQKA